MKSYESSAVIQATPAAVWAILADARAYPSWDSGVVKVEGQIGLGERISVYSSISPNRAFPVTVSELVPEVGMTWRGGMPMGLFKGVRTFALMPQSDGSTRFEMREEFSGPLLPVMWRMMPDLQPTFDQFTAGLKARAEASG
ncbi:MAG: SRPBCC domain-containing protein [Dehalococcoidia bacterium]